MKEISSRWTPGPGPTWKGLHKLLKADLHVHTKYSMDCNTPLERLITRCNELGINCLAIADHGTVEGALKMQEIAPFTVIVAQEILTHQGEIMGVFLKHTIPTCRSALEAIERIRAQDGLVCIPHPFDTFRGLRMKRHEVESLAGEIDIIETFNARSPLPWPTTKATAFADKHGIAKSAGSDAHSASELGNAYVEMPEFEGKEDYLQALAKGKIKGFRSNPLVHLNTIWAKIKRAF